MRSKNDIEQEVLKYQVAQNRLQAELGQLQGREAAALELAGEALLEGSEDGAVGKLVELRGRRAVIEQALSVAGERLRIAGDELKTIQMSEAARPWSAFQSTWWPWVEKLEAAIGEGGINGEIAEKLSDLQAAMESYRIGGGHGQPDLVTPINSSLVAVSRQLLEIWKILEGLEKSYNPNHKGRGVSTNSEYISGFGKRY